MKKCEYCGKNLSDTAVKCRYCKQRVSDPADVNKFRKKMIGLRNKTAKVLTPRVYLRGVLAMIVITLITTLFYLSFAKGNVESILLKVIYVEGSKTLVTEEAKVWLEMQVFYFCLFRIVFVLCAISLLYGKNIARLAFMWICMGYIIFYGFHMYGFANYFGAIFDLSDDKSNIIDYLWLNRYGFLFMILYPLSVVVYLSNPFVKKQYN